MILSVNPVADVCVGGKASFEIKKNGDLPGQIFWTFSHRNLPKNEHYKENADKTVLDINNALPIHAGKYTVIVVKGGKWLMGSTSFDLIVRGEIITIRKHYTAPCRKYCRDMAVLLFLTLSSSLLFFIHSSFHPFICPSTRLYPSAVRISFFSSVHPPRGDPSTRPPRFLSYFSFISFLGCFSFSF